jgi:thiamine-phosphate pyrophosphorylase
MLLMLDPFYLIVDSIAWLERLLPCGVKLVQLRIKDKTDTALQSEIAAGKALCDKYGAQLIVNDYWQLAIDEACDYIHLGQEDLDNADINAIRKAGLKLGISTHDECELDRALSFRPDYIALGPIYPTILKQMPFAPQGLEKLGEWRKRVGNLPLVGIGGLSVERGIAVLKAGANCAAAVTDITLNADPEARVKEWVASTRVFVTKR